MKKTISLLPRTLSGKIIILILLAGLAPLVTLGALGKYMQIQLYAQIESSLQEGVRLLSGSGQRFIQKTLETYVGIKTRDQAELISKYLETHPQMTLKMLLSDPFFRKLATFKVGKDGGSLLVNARSGQLYLKPGSAEAITDFEALKEKNPDYAGIIMASLGPAPAKGYYRIKNQNGQTRTGYLSIYPLDHPTADGIRLSAAADIRLDEVASIYHEAEAIIDNSLQGLKDGQDRIVRGVRSSGAGLTAMIVLLIILMALAMGRYVARTVKKLDNAIARVRDGDYEVHLDQEAFPDLAGLMANFNEMAGQLAQSTVSRERLEAKQEELKSQIRLRAVAEERLRESRERLRLIYEITNDFAYFTNIDPQGKMSLGWHTGSLKRQFPEIEFEKITTGPLYQLRSVLTPEGRESLAKRRRALLANQRQETDVNMVMPDGRKVWVRLVSQPIWSKEEKRVVGVMTAGKEVTAQVRALEEKKELEDSLIKSQRLEAVGTLAGGVAHDFNNLLMSIQGNASLAKLALEKKSSCMKYLGSIEHQVEGGAKLTDQLLGFARKGRYNVKPLDLNRLIIDSLDTFSRTNKQCTISLRLAPDLKAVPGDEVQLTQVLLNLLINARDAMPLGGQISIETSNIIQENSTDKPQGMGRGKHVSLAVTDQGQGMDEAVLARIFEPFFTTKERGRGTGLGLASVYGIVKGHGGHIEVNTEKNGGSTFQVFLPATNQATVSVTPPETAIALGEGTIMLVDDEARVLDVCQELIESFGYQVITCSSGGDAITTYRNSSKKIDLVILDMIMPGMNGGEVFDQLRLLDPRVKVLLASGYSQDGLADQVMERGCNGFLQKPFNPNELSAKIKKILENKA